MSVFKRGLEMPDNYDDEVTAEQIKRLEDETADLEVEKWPAEPATP